MSFTQKSQSFHSKNSTNELTCEEKFEAIRLSKTKLITEIYREYLPIVMSYISRRNGNSEDARDIFQQALLIIYKNVQKPDFSYRTSFGAYIVTICRNLWSKELRKSSRMTNDVPIEVFEVDETFTPIDTRIEEEEKNQLFQKVFATLPKDAQKVLTLYFEGKKMREIAKIMGYASEGYAKKRKCVFQKRLIETIKANPAYGELAI